MKTQLEVMTWDGEAEFEITPRSSATGLHRFSAACRQMFQNLKNKIAGELSWRFASVRPVLLLQAVNEASALAATTPFPALFLPVLAEEKVYLVSEWERKQRSIQDRSWLRAA
jgi:hypothetical protein